MRRLINDWRGLFLIVAASVAILGLVLHSDLLSWSALGLLVLIGVSKRV